MIDLLESLPKKMACAFIRCYQYTRFLRRPSCRFYPSCSEYTLRSIQRHGLLKGVIVGISRISRCHPWNAGGVDEVPESIHFFHSGNYQNTER